MSAAPSRTEAKYDQIAGSAKETVGYAVGNKSLQQEGKAQTAQGDIQDKAASVNESIQHATNKVADTVQAHIPTITEGKSDKLAGSIKQNVGSAVGNESLQSEGAAQHGQGVIMETAAVLQQSIQNVAETVYGAVQNAYNGPSKTEGRKDEFVGNVKEKTGRAVGNESLQAEGASQNLAGTVQNQAAVVSGYVQGAADQLSGAVKGAYNALTGDSVGEAQNKVQEKTGEAQKTFNSHV